MQIITEQKQTPITASYDTIVVGGGTAGVVAALAAARGGAKTAVIESGSVLGGTLLGGGIIWMSFFNNFLAHDVEKKQVVKGIAAELVDRMAARGFGPGHYEERVCVGHESMGTHVDREHLIRVLLDLLTAEGIELYLRTRVSDAVMDQNRITGVVIENKSGRQALLARTVIDASGDGEVSVQAGARWIDKRERHPIGYIFGMGNVDLEKARQYAKTIGLLSHLGYGDKGSETDRIVRLEIDWRKYDHPVIKPFMQAHGHWGPYIISTHENEATYINGMSTQPYATDTIGGMDYDLFDVESVSKAAIFLRKRTEEYAEKMRCFIPGFENAYLNWGANNLGIRSTRCLVCDYDITREDVVNSHIPEDRVALFGSSDAFGFGFTIEGGKWFGIPYRALLPQGVENLLTAGRVITSDFVAHMSTRLVVASMAQGEAAGTAAAMSVARKTTPRLLPVSDLQDQLRKNGVLLEL